MTKAEFALLRVLRAGSDLAMLPIEILKRIIRMLNLRRDPLLYYPHSTGLASYLRRRSLPRFFDEMSFDWRIATGMDTRGARTRGALGLPDWGIEIYRQWGIPDNKPFYGPGY